MMKDLRGLVSLMSSLLSVRCKGPTLELSGGEAVRLERIVSTRMAQAAGLSACKGGVRGGHF